METNDRNEPDGPCCNQLNWPKENGNEFTIHKKHSPEKTRRQFMRGVPGSTTRCVAHDGSSLEIPGATGLSALRRVCIRAATPPKTLDCRVGGVRGMKLYMTG